MLPILITNASPHPEGSDQDFHPRTALGSVVASGSGRPAAVSIHPFLKVFPPAVGLSDLGHGHGPAVLLKGMEKHE